MRIAFNWPMLFLNGISDVVGEIFEPINWNREYWMRFQTQTPEVDEIGWTELAPGGNTPASSRVDWIEVYGRPVARR